MIITKIFYGMINEWNEHKNYKVSERVKLVLRRANNEYFGWKRELLRRKIRRTFCDINDPKEQQLVSAYFQIKLINHQKRSNWIMALLTALLVYVTWLLVKATILLAKLS